MVEFAGKSHVEQPDQGSAESWMPVTCGHCGTAGQAFVVARPKAVHAKTAYSASKIRWLWCTHCGEPLSRDESGAVSPGPMFGPAIQGLPEDVEEAYTEARRCMSVNAYNATEMMCRKILMHVAVDKGAAPKKPFAHYLKYLGDEGYITPHMKGWTDLIRSNANEAAHELPSPSRKRAESTVWFTAELLRIVYEMEYLANQHQPASVEEEAEATGDEEEERPGDEN